MRMITISKLSADRSIREYQSACAYQGRHITDKVCKHRRLIMNIQVLIFHYITILL